MDSIDINWDKDYTPTKSIPFIDFPDYSFIIAAIGLLLDHTEQVARIILIAAGNLPIIIITTAYSLLDYSA